MAEEKPFDVVVMGSIFVDFMCYADRLPNHGETITGTDFKTGFGGKGANQCVAAQRLGSKTAFIGKIGNDNHGNQYYGHLKTEGVNVDCIQVDETFPTGATSIMVGTRDGENMIIVAPGATGRISPLDIQRPLSVETIKNSKILACQLETPFETSLEAMSLAKANGVTTILNVAPAKSDLPQELFGVADILCINETEAEIITGVTNVQELQNAKRAIAKLVSDFGSKTVIITLGPDGALLWDHVRKEHHVTIVPTFGPVVDTTGAGDCFIGTLAHCLSHGDDITVATDQAVRNASFSVLTKGTQTSYPHDLK